MTYTFGGENCRIFIEKKGGSSIELTGRLYSGDLTLPTRTINYERTDAGHIPSIEGYEPGNVSLNFYFDEDDTLDRMSSYLGSQTTQSGLRIVKLSNDRPELYKITFLFENYGDTFGGTPETAVKIIYYNVRGISLQNSLAVDSAFNGVLQFTFIPFDRTGKSNYIEIEKNTADSVANFNSIESAYDTEMGY